MIFSVKGGCFDYEDRQILSYINFSLKDSEVMTVLGPNGVGKTTLLRCMMGLLKWKQGDTFINGKTLRQLSNTEIWRQIAYVPQSKGTALSYTAREMVLMGRSTGLGIFAQPGFIDYEAADEAMERVGITKLANKQCSCMSGGELQMVLIARALSANPKLLVLDEPESNLDFKNQLIVLDTIQRLSQEEGIGAVVNTHYPAHALKIADKALVLDYSGNSKFGDVKSIVNEENMLNAFQVEVKIVDFDFENRKHQGVIPIGIRA
ncbi:MAG: ABC transporter ATP-binding protein [Lachnospiraceae bacterium]|nr:ABC transporter ATP-binding protein [Lachnospiraceae bacterium]